jgi:hypothetical protein
MKYWSSDSREGPQNARNAACHEIQCKALLVALFGFFGWLGRFAEEQMPSLHSERLENGITIFVLSQGGSQVAVGGEASLLILQTHC